MKLKMILVLRQGAIMLFSLRMFFLIFLGVTSFCASKSFGTCTLAFQDSVTKFVEEIEGPGYPNTEEVAAIVRPRTFETLMQIEDITLKRSLLNYAIELLQGTLPPIRNIPPALAQPAVTSIAIEKKWTNPTLVAIAYLRSLWTAILPIEPREYIELMKPNDADKILRQINGVLREINGGQFAGDIHRYIQENFNSDLSQGRHRLEHADFVEAYLTHRAKRLGRNRSFIPNSGGT